MTKDLSAKVSSLSLEDAHSKSLPELLNLLPSVNGDSLNNSIEEICNKVKAHVKSIESNKLAESLIAHLEDNKSNEARQNALTLIGAICEKIGSPVEPYLLLQILVPVMDRLADKQGGVRTEAERVYPLLLKIASPFCYRRLVKKIFECLENSKKWQIKIGALTLLTQMVEASPRSMCYLMSELVPVLSTVMWSTKPEVKSLAEKTLGICCSTIGNQDIEKVLPRIINCIANPSDVPETVFQLAATTFVKQVEAPTLAITVPLLNRGLNEPVTAIKRQCAVIIDNMCKLVEEPRDVEQFLPELMPKLERVIETVADPECRNVAERALKTLVRVGGGGIAHVKTPEEKLKELEHSEAIALHALKELVAKTGNKVEDNSAFHTSLVYVSSLCSFLEELRYFEIEDWKKNAINPYLGSFLSESEMGGIAQTVLDRCKEDLARREKKTVEEEVDEGEELCNCEFSLAYGGMILLNNTKFRLIRGHRYGLCGPNGVGKSTLMRSIANGQLEGFPAPDVLRTVYVAHELQASDDDVALLDFVANDPKVKGVPREEVVETLKSVGFTDAFLSGPFSALSGGWRMKLELARAMLQKADILLLDEPTNHLDVTNVAWLENYLTSLTNVTSIVVSHDSGFLDNVCTNIIHYEHRKLKVYKGNLSEFVKKVPEAKSYYSLEAARFSFKFPEPGFLEGIKSKDKAIMKMKNVTFTYPGRDKPVLTNINIQCSLSSRIAVLGANGAGKSTMIKLLTGELIPDAGEVYKHPNLRIAYVAQHAFHHIEQHLDKTPNQYIQWRYQYGEDKELLSKESRQISEEEQAQMDKKIAIDGEKRQFEKIMGRRKLKRDYEYEVKWVGMTFESNTWHPRDELIKWGFEKVVQRYDDKEAAMAGMYRRPLTAVEIEKHLKDIGLDPEFATHSRMRGLSGGQKVKVVLGAALWNCPHMIVLDEPTNYLDRDSLGALAGAITSYGGGVVMISHNREFFSALCPERWNVANGTLYLEGQPIPTSKEVIEVKVEEEVRDAFGNVEKVKAPKKTKLSRKEKMARDKKRKQKLANGEALSSDDEDL